MSQDHTENTSAFAACTIVSKNYLSLARVWNDSIQRHHPGTRTFVLIVDRIQGAFDRQAEGFDVIEAEELGIPEFLDMAFKYNILELNTAVKPFFLDHLFRHRNVERLVYFDPDTVLYGRMDKAQEMLDEKQIVVVPHVLTPQKLDGRRPDETDFLISGAYNLGFLALKKCEEVFSFLRWWQERLADFGFSAPERGLFTDQKWIDLVPSIFSGVGILKNRGYNVAYWNIQERMDLVETDGKFGFPECPLTFFHFSGLEFDRPERISKYQNRFRFDRLPPAYRKIILGYVDSIRKAGFDETRKLRYAFDYFEDGVRISPFIRRLFHRQGVDRRRWVDPFLSNGNATFRSWLLERCEFGSKIPRLLELIYDSRPDLQAAIPGGEAENAKSLLSWAVHCRKEYNLDDFFARHFQGILDEIEAEQRAREREAREQAARAELEAQKAKQIYFGEPQHPGLRAVHRLLTPPIYRKVRHWIWQYRSWKGRRGNHETQAAPADAPIRFIDRSLPVGVNVFGYFDTESGVGEMARLYAESLRAAGVPIAMLNIRQKWLRRSELRFHSFDTSAPYGVNLIAVNADQVPHILPRIGKGALDGRYNIGHWAWELPEFPEGFRGAFAFFDEIWTNSTFVQRSIAGCSPIPVFSLSPGFDLHPPGQRDRESFDLDADDFVVLFTFDNASNTRRKNPAGLIRAFQKAFPTPGKECLVLKTMNMSERTEAAFRRLARDSRVRFINEYLQHGAVLDLIQNCDVYASLHRSEGFGISLIEAMAFGKPTLATNFSGNCDFLNASNGFPVSYRLAELKRNFGPYAKGNVWAEPALEEAAGLLRWIRAHPQEARCVAARARAEIASQWTLAERGKALRDRLEHIRTSPSDERVASPPSQRGLAG